MASTPDPFFDTEGSPRVLRGVTINSNAPRLAELAGLIGFETVWIDVEHGTAGYAEIEMLCMAAESGGAIPTVRIPDQHRHHVLRTVEAGARIVVVPMIEDAEQAREIVTHGKFAPLGCRGFNTKSRGVRYGLEPVVEAFPAANRRTHFFAQIESLRSVSNLESILRVDGLAGVFIGPGDLSASLGRPGEFGDRELLDMVSHITQQARRAGRHAGILAAPGPLLDAALHAGADLVFAGSDLGDLTVRWRSLLAGVPSRSA
jgi:2-keto-3-deoxy-L-rhamnonate aldolase RhmA